MTTHHSLPADVRMVDAADVAAAAARVCCKLILFVTWGSGEVTYTGAHNGPLAHAILDGNCPSRAAHCSRLGRGLKGVGLVVG